jgi:competence transcription factor ComK
MKTINEASEAIREGLEIGYSSYFNMEDSNGETVKIRVSDHSANKQNNSCKTLSFIQERTEQRKSGYNQMFAEWVVLENGLTDTYESIEDVLSYELGF